MRPACAVPFEEWMNKRDLDEVKPRVGREGPKGRGRERGRERGKEGG